MKKFDFLHSAVCKMLEKKKQEIRYIIVTSFKLMISVSGGHCDYSAREPKNSYATAAHVRVLGLGGEGYKPVMLN